MRPLFSGLALLLLLAPAVDAQRYTSPPRFGVGFESFIGLSGDDVLPDGPSLGVRARVALPLNRDVSVAGGLGLGSHLFEGADDARVVMNPQASVIVTLPSRGSARYVFGGVGGVVPFSGGGGATFHIGYGLAIPLTDTSLFAEINPQIVVGERETVPALAIRGGVIF